MKEEYLKELKEKLETSEIKDKDNIYTRYEARYNFGLEAGLKDEEIEEKLGTVDSIISQHIVDEKAKEGKFESYELLIRSVIDDVKIDVVDDIDNIQVQFDNNCEEFYKVTKEDNKFTISYLENKFLLVNRKESGTILVSIPSKIKLSSISITSTTGNLEFDKLETENFSLKNTSGDVKGSQLTATNLSLSTVSGDVFISKVISTSGNINSVSGDYKFDYYKGDLKISTVSGDVISENFFGNYKANSVSGDIIINQNKESHLLDKISNKLNKIFN